MPVAAVFRSMRDRLPSLYRPEGGEGGLLTRYLVALARVLDRVNVDATVVMQAHWFPTADRVWTGPPSPWIVDLARLGSLLAILPWEAEAVEDYRARIERIVELYREGLGTLPAMRRMTGALAPGVAFTVEEALSRPVPVQAVPTRGEPVQQLGPLMRWRLHNGSNREAPLTLYVQAEPVATRSIRPLIELFESGGARARLGIAFEGPLAAGKTLRLQTGHGFWVGGDAGLLRALSVPGEAPANTAVRGPWSPEPSMPVGRVTALVQSRDRALWAAAEFEGSGALWRFDGRSWARALDGLPRLLCLALDGDALLLGTETGLLRRPLYPSASQRTLKTEQVLSGFPVHALLAEADGVWWLGTGQGLFRQLPGKAPERFGPLSVPVYALHQDVTGSLYAGGDLGLFRYQRGLDHWYWYAGSRSEQEGDWRRLEQELPKPQDVSLRPVHAIHRGSDPWLWIGTDQGIFRYGARSVGGLTYTTDLEEFPELEVGTVHAIAEDARGSVWFATAKGLLCFDGLGWSQARKSGDGMELVEGGPLAEEPAVCALLWTDHAVADLGTWDGATFTKESDVSPTRLRMRYKPDDSRIVDGGLPAVPRLPSGESVWRYLSLEPTRGVAKPKSRPAWTVEGRLLPPPGNAPAAEEGRYGARGLELSGFDEAVFAFPPEARVWAGWEEARTPGVLVRLRSRGEAIDPAVLDRVWQGIQQVRPAGVPARLAVDEQTVRGT